MPPIDQMVVRRDNQGEVNEWMASFDVASMDKYERGEDSDGGSVYIGRRK